MALVVALLTKTALTLAVTSLAETRTTETETPAFVQRGWAVRRADIQQSLAIEPPSPLLVLSYNVWWWGNPSSNNGRPTTDYASLPGMHAYWKSLPRVHIVGVQECDGGWATLSSYFKPAVDYLTEVVAERGPLCTLYDAARLTVISSGSVNVWEYRYLEYVRLRERSTDTTIFFVNTHWDHHARDSDKHAQRTAQAINDHATSGDIVIVTGDFNLPPYVHVFAQIFESQLGLRLEGRGSSHAQIDMIWTNHDGESSCASPEDTAQAGTGSDHNPVLCQFDIDSGAALTGNTGSKSQDTYEYVGAPKVGGWGGRCRCPSGHVYDVGDNYDSCASLACVGGEIVEPCGEGVLSVSRGGWRVKCGLDNEIDEEADPVVATPAPSPTQTSASDSTSANDEYVYVGQPNVGGWGGLCKCPSGKIYEVGDNNDGCGSLACVGGTVAKECGDGGISRARAGWRVKCGADTSDADIHSTAPQSEHTEQPDSTWAPHLGTNCYPGFGADGIRDKDPCPGAISLEQCKRECISEPTCVGIVMHSHQTVGTCWLRRNVELSSCLAPNSGYDFWLRSP